MRKQKLLFNVILQVLIFSALFLFNGAQKNSTAQDKSSTVKSEKFDVGKMWTFEHAPVDYFGEAYNFKPTRDWLDNVRMSALRFGNGCSASFISEDGLVMTNHHCGRGYVTQITKPGEKLSETGFFAETLADERPVPGLFVDQLIKVVDVTNDIQTAMESGKTDAEKQKSKNDKIKEIETKYSSELSLKCNVITFYNGGMYMLYCYKRYTDVKLVFAPENYVAHFGGDPDNFTYPRYDYDCMFFRVYDADGNPMKSPNFFKWSSGGASVGEPLFVVGNPGSTERLKTYSQLEFARDITVPARLKQLDFMVGYLDKYISDNPDKKLTYQDALFGNQNSQKVYTGQVKALNDPVMMARKKDFEDIIKAKVNADANLKSKYGKAWDDIAAALNDYRKIYDELAGYDLLRGGSRYFTAARLLVKNSSEGKQTPDSLIKNIYKKFDADYNNGLLQKECEIISDKLGSDNPSVKKVFGVKNASEMTAYILEKSKLTGLDAALELAQKDPQAVLASDDPLIMFVKESKPRYDELTARQKDIQARVDVNSAMLGRILFEIYGTSIPPDATLTLRISDGVIQSYPYNGTIAPPFTTFYGIYDRYFSHGKKYPWLLPERWQNPPAEFKLETPYNLISTNDIIGGNSGSAIINRNAEVVGLVFDGNIESLPGRYIYTTEANRTISIDSRGLLEAIKNLYKATRLSNEITNGKL